MSRINRYFYAACDIADKSIMLHKHGAVLVSGGKMVTKGHNSFHPNHKHGSCFMHAEMNVIRKIYQKKLKNCKQSA